MFRPGSLRGFGHGPGRAHESKAYPGRLARPARDCRASATRFVSATSFYVEKVVLALVQAVTGAAFRYLESRWGLASASYSQALFVLLSLVLQDGAGKYGSLVWQLDGQFGGVTA